MLPVNIRCGLSSPGSSDASACSSFPHSDSVLFPAGLSSTKTVSIVHTLTFQMSKVFLAESGQGQTSDRAKPKVSWRNHGERWIVAVAMEAGDVTHSGMEEGGCQWRTGRKMGESAMRLRF